MNAQDFLRCVSDSMTQVRNERGQLLGCIPRLNETSTGVRGNDGQPYMLRIMAVSGICVPNDCDPTRVIPGFIPMDAGRNADLALPPEVQPTLDTP